MHFQNNPLAFHFYELLKNSLVSNSVYLKIKSVSVHTSIFEVATVVKFSSDIEY